MFSITLRLKNFTLKGIKAIDWCRANGLAESNDVNSYNHAQINCDVDEAFARAWFSKEQNDDTVTVHDNMLVPQELKWDRNDDQSGKQVVFGNITTERAKELYIAAKFKNRD